MTETTLRAFQTEQTENTPLVRRATPDDALNVYELISSNVLSGHLLERSLEEVQQHATRFFAAIDSEELVGCGELAHLSVNVAEVRSLVVKNTKRKQGIGTGLLKALIDEAVSLHVPRLCAFTHSPRPFVQSGFSIVPHPWISPKIEIDCQTCDLFRCCDRYAVVLDLTSYSGATR
ncbi:MAG: GNAT family N-acetyltransferase [Vicinamibacterales bacterium]